MIEVHLHEFAIGGTKVEGDEQKIGQPLSAKTIGAILAVLRLETTKAREEGST